MSNLKSSKEDFDILWIVRYNDGSVDVFETEQPPPAIPYISVFDVDRYVEENIAG
jgi:hypothetical protein